MLLIYQTLENYQENAPKDKRQIKIALKSGKKINARPYMITWTFLKIFSNFWTD